MTLSDVIWFMTGICLMLCVGYVVLLRYWIRQWRER